MSDNRQVCLVILSTSRQLINRSDGGNQGGKRKGRALTAPRSSAVTVARRSNARNHVRSKWSSRQKRSCSCRPTLRRRVRASRYSKARSVRAASSPNAAVVGPVVATYTLPENTYFRLRMDQNISSETARRGDRFKATVLTPVYASG